MCARYTQGQTLSCWLRDPTSHRALLLKPRRPSTSLTTPRTKRVCLDSAPYVAAKSLCKLCSVTQVAQASRDSSDREQEVVTFFTSEGLVQLPKWQAPSRTFKPKQQNPLPTWQEQGLCIGNTFWISATNETDICRRLKLMGYCRCTEFLSDVVESTVLNSGGKIVTREHRSSSGLHETLYMTVAIPLLWGIPPRHETLSTAISSGGGVVEKVYRQWQLYK